MSLQRILYVASEIAPFLESSIVAVCMRSLPEAMQHKQIDVRIVVPKFGIINDRMNRLHEVLRLSGNAIALNEVNYEIIVKVSTIPNTRLQVYFIDNQALFGSRKAVFKDANDNFFEDNDLRMVFFCISVMETLKKLEWEPDIVHCHDWITGLLPLFWKKVYQHHPLFVKAKLLTTIYNNTFSNNFPMLAETLGKIGVTLIDIPWLSKGDFAGLMEVVIHYSDYTLRGETINATEFENLPITHGLPLLENDVQCPDHYWSLYRELIASSK